MQKTSTFRLSAILVVVALGFSACQKEQINPTPVAPELTDVSADGVVGERSTGTVVDVAVNNPNFSALVAAVVKTNLVSFLSTPGLSSTVFAPNNAAFAQLPAPFNTAANINGINDEATINTLRNILRFHVVPGRRTATQLTNGNYGTFMSPPSPGANILTVSRNLSNAVFINGGTQVIATNINASNGIIHVIDKVLFPPTQSIAEIAVANGSFTALVAALAKTNQSVNFLGGNTTVFAPTDAAFAQLPAPLNNAANISAITDPNTIATLRNVLRLHLIPARVYSPDLRNNQVVPTRLSNSTLTVTTTGGAKVRGAGNTTPADIILVDILATNGVIHAVNRVLLP
jgi:uncharacterized surface protein with fasciclin (FAS1) repeats